MPESHPLAQWLSVFLTTDQPYHWEHTPQRLRPLIAERRWELAYPFTAAFNRPATISAIRVIKDGTAMVRWTPWLYDPEVRLLLLANAVDFLADHISLTASDLDSLAAAESPLRIGVAAPRVALILYTLSSRTAPLYPIHKAPARLIKQLVGALKRDMPAATPADLFAIHVLMRRLLALNSQAWTLEALQLCLPFSPLTRLLEDSAALVALAPYDWAGVEAMLSSLGLEGLRIRCAQALVESTLPGWRWHMDSQAVMDARFRRTSGLLELLVAALDRLDGPRAMRLATWFMRFYELFAQSLELYQRVLLPPPLDPRNPTWTPSFRLLAQFFPVSAEELQENYAGVAAPIAPMMALLIEASRLTSLPVYIPDGLPDESRSADYPDSVPLRTEAEALIGVWKSMDTRFGPTLSALYQYVCNASQPAPEVPLIAEPASETSGEKSLLDSLEF